MRTQTHKPKMSAVVQMPPAFDASLRECCAQAVQQAVAVLAARAEWAEGDAAAYT